MSSPEQRWVEERVVEQLEAALVNREGAKALLDLASADDVLRQDYAERFVYELLQNGSDAQRKWARDRGMDPEIPGRIVFQLVGDWLLVANDGASFSHEPDPGKEVSSIEAFTRIGESTKDEGYAGNKGIGSRSIYEVCDRLRIISGRYWLLFDTHKLTDAIEGAEGSAQAISRSARQLLLESDQQVPMLRVAFWNEDLEPEIAAAVAHLRNGRGFTTVLTLHLRDPGDRESVREKVLRIGAPELVLLRNVRSLEFIHDGHPEDGFELFMGEPTDAGRCVDIQEGGRHRTFRVFGDLERFDAVRVAVEIDEHGKPRPMAAERRVFHTFYPAPGGQHGVPLLIHGYFELTPDRKNLAARDENRLALDEIVELIGTEVAPAFLPGCSGTELVDVLVPRMSVDDAEADAWDRFSPDELPLADRLTAWFRWRLCNRLRTVALIRSGDEELVPQGLPVGRGVAELADELSGVIGLHAGHVRLSKLPEAIRNALGLVDLAVEHVEERLPLRDSEPVQAGRVVRLLLKLDPDAAWAERFRDRGYRILPAHDGSLRPLPQPEQIFVVRVPRVPSAQVDDDDVVSVEVPTFLGIWMLHADVLADPTCCADSSPRALCDEWVKKLGVREFSVDDLLEGLHGEWIGDELTEKFQEKGADERCQLLRFVIDLVLRGWFAEPLRNGVLPEVPSPWFTAYRHDFRGGKRKTWPRSYLASRCPIPVGDGWVPAHKVVFGGGWNLLEGFDPDAVYRDTDVEVLGPGASEARWLREFLDELFAQRLSSSAAPEDSGEPLEPAELCRSFYLHMGVHPTVAISAVQSTSIGHAWPERQLANHNPHYGVPDQVWKRHLTRNADRAWASFSSVYNQLWTVRSMALAHADQLVRWHGRQKEHRLLTALVRWMRTWGVIPQDCWRNTSGSRKTTHSLLHEQLLEADLWLDERCEREADQGPLWYASDQSPMLKPGGNQRVRYARTVTGACLDPGDARFLGLPDLDHVTSSTRLVAELERLTGELPRDGVRRPRGRGETVLIRDLYGAAERLVAAGELDPGKLAILGVPCVRIAEDGTRVFRASPGEDAVYFDDEDMQIPSLSRAVNLAMLPTTCKTLASKMGLRLLSEADLEPVDDLSAWEQEEADLLDQLMEVKPALLAFLCYAAFIPEASRLKFGLRAYRERRDALRRDGLGIEIVPSLGLKIDGSQPFQAFEGTQRCFVEPQGRPRRIFVQGSGDDEHLLERLAPAVARLLRVRGQQITIQMLLRQWDRQREEFVRSTVLGDLGISPKDYERVQDDVAGDRDRRRRRRAALVALLERLEIGVEGLRPSWTADHPDLLRHVRGAGRLQAYVDAARDEGWTLRIPATCADVFAAEKASWTRAAVCASVQAAGRTDAATVSEVKQRWRSSDLDGVPSDLRFDPDGGKAACRHLLVRFLVSAGAPAPGGGETPAAYLARAGVGVLEEVYPTPREDIDKTRKRYLPHVVAVIVEHEALDRGRIGRLAEAYDDLPRPNSLEELRSEIAGFLVEHGGLTAERAEGWLERFPDLPDDEPVTLESVKGILNSLNNQQNSDLDRMIREYTNKLRRLLGDAAEEERGELLLGEVPELDTVDRGEVDPTTVEEPEAPPSSEEDASDEPERPDAADDEDDPYDKYVVQNTRRALTGRRGEAFAVLCVLHSWESLATRDAARARKMLDRLAGSWANLDPERVAPLMAASPDRWTTDPELSRLLERLVRVGGTSMKNDRLGYDLIGLDEDGTGFVRIEVKATTSVRQKSFLITDNELETARRYGKAYEIWHVRGVHGGKRTRIPKYRIYRDPDAMVADGRLDTESVVRQVCPHEKKDE